MAFQRDADDHRGAKPKSKQTYRSVMADNVSSFFARDQPNPHLHYGLNIHKGKVTYKAVAASLNLP